MTIAILAGGRSRRMGRDKAHLLLGGESLLERLARAATEAVSEVLVVGRLRPENWPVSPVRFLEDEIPDVGPVGGLLTALHEAQGEAVLLTACDMPKLTTGTFQWLRDEADRRPLRDGLAVVRDGQIEPLFSVYRKSCLPLARERREAGHRSLVGLIAAGRFARVDAPPDIAQTLMNVNTPEEWAALR